jgi:hypothetical protein
MGLPALNQDRPPARIGAGWHTRRSRLEPAAFSQATSIDHIPAELLDEAGYRA